MGDILKDSYWVVENKILGVRKPQSTEELNILKDLGMGGIISLLDDKENHNLYSNNEVDYCWIPVTGGKPPSIDQVEEAFKFAKKVWEQSKVLVVHCSGGRKRTATLIASILVKDNQAPTKALELIYTANPKINLNEEQLEFVKNL